MKHAPAAAAQPNNTNNKLGGTAYEVLTLAGHFHFCTLLKYCSSTEQHYS